ncbi:MAG: dUTP diphosphatase [Candidatus Thalassarchaeaceae archaeon]|nr:dUTP diphosphatase [Candidatus Thalassarchaeaceae archaeon]
MDDGVRVLFTRLHPDAKPPMKGSASAAGWDLRTVETCEIKKGESTKVPTGLAVAIPIGYEGQVRARSSLGAKGIILPNGIGTIDADYRGQIHVLMTWIGEGDSTIIEAGERVAQMVISPIPVVNFVEVDENQLGETERGAGGFGSTGRY